MPLLMPFTHGYWFLLVPSGSYRFSERLPVPSDSLPPETGAKPKQKRKFLRVYWGLSTIISVVAVVAELADALDSKPTRKIPVALLLLKCLVIWYALVPVLMPFLVVNSPLPLPA
jgi:hypothetical protein